MAFGIHHIMYTRRRNGPIGVIMFLMGILALASCMSPSARTALRGDAAVGSAYPSSATATPATISSPKPTRTVSPPTADLPTHTIAATATLTPQQILDEIRHLFDENGGCALPCWWGIEPGKTTWEEALTILSPLAMEIFPP